MEAIRRCLREIVENETKESMRNMRRMLDRLEKELQECKKHKRQSDKHKENIIKKLCPTCQGLIEPIPEVIIMSDDEDDDDKSK